MSHHHTQPSEDRLFLFEQQEVVVNDWDAPGYVLDIGGGGEGIIGILKGEKVVAIDVRREELEEAPDGPLKIVMDARELKFLDGAFSTVTAFFALMYLKSTPDFEKVFSEVLRVLKPGGQFLIWDVIVPGRLDDGKDIFVVPLTVKVNEQEIRTGYGQPWPGEEHDLPFYVGLAEKGGFSVVEQRVEGQTLFLKLQKP
jgi:ubiquinone/menaquinone biosynthesis C-methylase UbiE